MKALLHVECSWRTAGLTQTFISQEWCPISALLWRNLMPIYLLLQVTSRLFFSRSRLFSSSLMSKDFTRIPFSTTYWKFAFPGPRKWPRQAYDAFVIASIFSPVKGWPKSERVPQKRSWFWGHICFQFSTVAILIKNCILMESTTYSTTTEILTVSWALDTNLWDYSLFLILLKCNAWDWELFTVWPFYITARKSSLLQTLVLLVRSSPLPVKKLSYRYLNSISKKQHL